MSIKLLNDSTAESKAKQLLFLNIAPCVQLVSAVFIVHVSSHSSPSIYTIHTSLHHSSLPHGLLYVTPR